MDLPTILILAIPGTAIGIAYIRAFNYPLPGIGIPLTSMWIILPIVLALRRLPYTVRGSYSPRCSWSTSRWKRRRGARGQPGCGHSGT